MEQAADSGASFLALFSAVVLVRFALPFTILRYPLPGVLACLVVDAADQTIFQWFGYDPPFYQGYDKAMDVFYLAMAYISMLRNWTDPAALVVARLLFYWRQVGVALYELIDLSALLMIFPNTFEYFFIAYEAARTRWKLARVRLRTWIIVAAAIWVFVKLPQEWWIHIAKRDFTETVQTVPWFGPAVVLGLVLLLGIYLLAVRPRLRPADHPLTLRAPPIPAEIATAAQRAAWVAAHGRVRSRATLDKALLVGLLGVIFATLLPGPEPHPLELLLWVAALVVVNAAVSLRVVRRGHVIETALGAFAARLVVNTALVAVTVLVTGGQRPLVDSLFFAVLFSVVIAAYDLARPVYDVRMTRPSPVEG